MTNYNVELSEELMDCLRKKPNQLIPSELAQGCSIEVKQENLPCSTLGIYTKIGNRSFILVNDSDTNEIQEYVIALGIYYHSVDKPRIILRSGPVDGDYSAGHFAYQLHLRSNGAFYLPESIIEKGKGLMN